MNETCPRCEASCEPHYNYCNICGLKLAAATTTAENIADSIDDVVPQPIGKERFKKIVKSTI